MPITAYRMRLEPQGADEDANPFEFCRENEIIGVGHELSRDQSVQKLEDVKQAHKDYHSGRVKDNGSLIAEIRYMLEMDEGDYVWINQRNEYHLCRVLSNWRVSANQSEDDYRIHDFNDIHNYRHVEWKRIPQPFVPGPIQRRFVGSFGTLTIMDLDDETLQKTDQLFQAVDLDTSSKIDDDLIKTEIYQLGSREFFKKLGATETEDIVLNFLQSRGWKIIKSSTSRSTAEIECELKRGPDRAYVQVKSGHGDIDPSKYEKYTGLGHVFFFTLADFDVGSHLAMTKIDPSDVKEYVDNNVLEIPDDVLIRLARDTS